MLMFEFQGLSIAIIRSAYKCYVAPGVYGPDAKRITLDFSNMLYREICEFNWMTSRYLCEHIWHLVLNICMYMCLEIGILCIHLYVCVISWTLSFPMQSRLFWIIQSWNKAPFCLFSWCINLADRELYISCFGPASSPTRGSFVCWGD